MQNESQFIVLMQIYEKLNSIVLPSYYKLNFYNKDNKLEKDLLKVEPTEIFLINMVRLITIILVLLLIFIKKDKGYLEAQLVSLHY